MQTVDHELISNAIQAHRHVVVRARIPAELRLPRGVVGLRARCDGDRRPLGPLRDVGVKALRLLGDERGAMALGARGDLRRAGHPSALIEALANRVLHALNTLAANARGPAVLVLDEVASADDATLEALTHFVSTPGALRTSLVLAIGGEPANPLVRALVDATVEGGGVDATAPFERVGSVFPQDDGAWRGALSALPAEVVLTLRAAALVGDGFEVDDLVALRELSPLRAMEHLQIAKESGFPLDDTGESRLRMPEAVAANLRAGLLPSLAKRWHLTLAARRARPEERPLTPPPVPPPPSDDDPAVRHEAPRHRGDARGVHPRPVPVVAPEAVFAPSPPQPARDEATPRAAVVPLPSSVAASRDGARAAAHLAAAGDLEGAARELRGVVQEAAALGFPTRAIEHARHALGLLDSLPDNDARRALRAELLLMLGTVQWRASGPGEEFSLHSALESVRAARAALPARGHAELRARIAGALAGVCGEVGDLAALDEALRELTEVTRALLESGDAVDAARLLNDQAAVHLSLGDPVKAAWLLRQSREVFAERAESMAADDPRRAAVLHELAETDHLFGRLTLQARARPGRESDALALGREHVEAARSLFEELGAARDVARTLETLGRIETRAGHPRRAEEHLLAALAAEEGAGDVLGLARVTTALAELQAKEGRIDEALTRLSDATAFNLEKGSALGVAMTRRALDAMGSALAGAGEAIGARAEALRRELAAAEAIVGRVAPPA